MFSMRSIPTTNVEHAEGQKLNNTRMGFSRQARVRKVEAPSQRALLSLT